MIDRGALYISNTTKETSLFTFAKYFKISCWPNLPCRKLPSLWCCYFVFSPKQTKTKTEKKSFSFVVAMKLFWNNSVVFPLSFPSFFSSSLPPSSFCRHHAPTSMIKWEAKGRNRTQNIPVILNNSTFKILHRAFLLSNET